MAIVRVEAATHWTAEERRQVLAALQAGVVAALAVPAGDPTISIVEVPGTSMLVPEHASAQYALVTVTLFAGRSVDAKRVLCRALTEALTAGGVPAGDVDVVLVEQPLENWARAGVLACDRDLGFEIDV
jgi:phenylpyruvate tautomerase PptA (4-oxalocrotonate tautomerase family)